MNVVNVVTHEQEPLTVRDRLRILLAVLVAFAIVAVILWRFGVITHPPRPPQEVVYLRDVYVLIDVSCSMDPKRCAIDSANFAKAKELAARVVESCGPGDWVNVLTVGTGFSDERNIILNDGVLPVPIGFRDGLTAQADEDIAVLRRAATVNIESREWLPTIAQVPREPPDGRSDYLQAFDYVAERLRASAQRDRRYAQIVSLGDLEQTQMHVSGKPPAPEEADVDAFAGARIHLSYPYRERRDGKRMSRKQLEAYWREYFEQRGATDIVIAPFGAGVAIPPALASE